MAGWTLECLTVGPLQMNAWLLLDVGAAEAALIDPGDEATRLIARVEASGCRLRWLLATHGHFDHVAAAAEFQGTYDRPLRIQAEDRFLVDAMPDHQAAYGLPISQVPRLDATLRDGDEIPLGNGVLQVSAVPGHTPGHVMFSYDGHSIVGDCVFAGSIGRTDLPGGDFPTLEASIRERIYKLPKNTILHPGHGPDTTVGRERSTNPFVSDP